MYKLPATTIIACLLSGATSAQDNAIWTEILSTDSFTDSFQKDKLERTAYNRIKATLNRVYRDPTDGVKKLEIKIRVNCATMSYANESVVRYSKSGQVLGAETDSEYHSARPGSVIYVDLTAICEAALQK